MTQNILEVVPVRSIFTVKNNKGIHTRPATEIVKCAAKFKSDIFLTYKRMEVNAKSILGILCLAAGRGSRIAISACGPDAEEAVDALLDLAGREFNMEY